ncbi:hypothetical protein FTUN_4943 [Frigoriglobus tundricola]|uniref:Uncharacterized protein n=1 Tax=Frigoriglobus tundricola TaxID=2774151 RepID=A0A6M5YU08_9BACT|nr:hypothetical protein FTUN_4943 [Frigoriglobus tundricola]
MTGASSSPNDALIKYGTAGVPPACYAHEIAPACLVSRIDPQRSGRDARGPRVIDQHDLVLEVGIQRVGS